MPSPANITNITPPRVPLTDLRTGLISREWYRFFLNLFELTGAGQNFTSLTDLQVGPPSLQIDEVYQVVGKAGESTGPSQDGLLAQISEIQKAINGLEMTARPELGTFSALQQANLPWVTFDTTPDSVPSSTAGTLYWDSADGNQTLSLVMAGGAVTQQIGEEQYYRIKASSAITEGQVIMFTGTVGNSGALKGGPATGLTAATALYVMGVATESIANNGWGYVTSFGLVRSINTTGAAVGETWADGDILYLNPSVAGGLTKTVPVAPNPKVVVAAVVHAATNGSLFIRPSFGGKLGDFEGDVNVSSPVNGDLLIYDAVQGRWENARLTAGTNISITNGAGSITINSSNPGGTVTSVAMTVPSFLSVAGSPITSSGTLAVTLSGTALPVANGGTGKTSWVSGGLVYASGTTTLTNIEGFTFNNSASSPTLTFKGDQLSGTYYEGLEFQNQPGQVVSRIRSQYVGGASVGLMFDVTTGFQYQWQINGTTQVSLSSSGFNIAGLTASKAVFTDASKNLTSTGTLGIDQGGTGLTGTPTNGQLLIGNGTGYTLAALTAGSGVSISNSAGGISISATGTGGTVTSVGLSAPTGFAVTGSPVTTTGTLALAFASGYSLPTNASQTNWDTAYSERKQWDGGSTGLTASTGRTSLGATTVGSNLFTLTNPSAVTFLRVNADNTVSALDAATFRSAIGAGTGNGTVTSVAMTVPSFLSVSGSPVTGSGTLAVTLSGTALPVANGGTGLTSLTAGYIPFGNGTSAFNSNANLFWDNTNSYLGIGTTTPAGRVDMTGAAIKPYLSSTTTGTTTGLVYSTLAFRSYKGPGAGAFAYDDAWIQIQRANIEYGGDSFTHDCRMVFFTNGSNRDQNPYEVLSLGYYGLTAARTYNTTVGATNRDLYIDNTGLIGYVSSTRESKTNIASLDDVSWLLRLEPVAFNRRKKKPVVKNGQIVGHEYTDDTYDELEFGLIADDAVNVKPELCFYDIVGENERKLSGVNYGQLTTPLLKLVQQQQSMIDALVARVTRLEQGT